MVRVAYFSNQFADLEGHGLARYSRQLYGALTQNCNDIEIQPVAAWSSMGKDDLHSLKLRTGLKILPWGRRLTPLCWAYLNRPKIESWLNDPIDIVHAVALGYPIATQKPYVVTIHDIGPLTHPEFFTNTKPWVMQKSMVQAVDCAAAIICVSKSTANEVQTYLGKDLDRRIHVVYEGVDEKFFNPVSYDFIDNKPGFPAKGVPYILTTGKMSPRKNLPRIIRALKLLKDTISFDLVFVGAKGWEMKEIYSELKGSGMSSRVHFPGYVTDKELRCLYTHAHAYVHPSLYEGFGLTVLEAMAMGCPVVTSNTFSLPEVAGDAAILVNPKSTEDIAQGILQVCDDENGRKKLIEKGKLRAKTFTWKKCAENISAVYRQVA